MAEVFEQLCQVVSSFYKKPLPLESLESFAKADSIVKTLSRDLIKNLFFLKYLGREYIQGFEKFPDKFQVLFIIGCFEILFARTLSPPEIISPLLQIADKLAFKTPLKKVLHGSLGKISIEKQEILNREYSPSIRYSYPDHVFQILAKSLPEKTLTPALHAMHYPPAGLGFIYNKMLISGKELIRILKKNGCDLEESSQHTEFIRIEKGTDFLFKSDLFKEGKLYIQDFSMALLTRYLAVSLNNSETILDFCAAPGGKTIALASELSAYSPLFICHDVSVPRLQMLKENLVQRPWIKALIVTSCTENSEGSLSEEEYLQYLRDKTIPTKLRGKIYHVPRFDIINREQFDTVIVDAPCSGLGTIYKYPEIKYLFSRQEDFTEPQKMLLAKSKEFVKIHGSLYYLTCTLNRDENENIIHGFIRNNSNWGYYCLGELKSGDWKRDIIPEKNNPSGGFLAGIRRLK